MTTSVSNSRYNRGGPQLHRAFDLFSHCVSRLGGLDVFEKNYRLQDIQLSKTFELHTSKFKLQIVVENTGLEPVTSWLQTRRSPS